MSSTKTRRPSSELVELVLDARPDWETASIWDAGHMAPMTHPQLVNPIIRNFLGLMRSPGAPAIRRAHHDIHCDDPTSATFSPVLVVL
jgi:hypothetical protein